MSTQKPNKQDAIARQIVMKRAAVAEGVLYNLISGKGALTPEEMDAAANCSVQLAERFVKKLYPGVNFVEE